MQAISYIFELSLLASVLGFWPALFLIFAVWGHYNNREDVVSAPSKRIREWFPVIVYPWIGSVGIFFAVFLYLVFFVAGR